MAATGSCEKVTRLDKQTQKHKTRDCASVKLMQNNI